MKLKSLLIIFLILGCFMAVTAVRPASAAFDAEVSIISEFNEGTMKLQSTRNGVALPMKDPNDHYYDNKAVVSTDNNYMLHIDVSDYGRKVQYGDVLINFYANENLWPKTDPPSDPVAQTPILKLQYTAPLTNANRYGCDVEVPDIGVVYNWIKVIVKDSDGSDPVYTWFKFMEPGDVPAVDITPANAVLWTDTLNPVSGAYEDLIFHKSLYVTVNTLNANDRVYSWLVDFQGNKIAESDELSNSAALSVDLAEMSDANFVIRYTDARSEGDLDADDWNGEFEQLEVKHAYYESSLAGELNPLTNYQELDDYTILMPYYEDLGTTIDAYETALDSAEIYYDGKKLDNDGATIGGTPAYDPDDTNEWVTVAVSNLPTDDTAENWSFSSSKVVVLFEDSDGQTHVAGVDDGVGPRLLRAYVRYDQKQKLVLKFSEDLDPAAISTSAVKPDIYLTKSDYISSIALNPDDASELVLTASTAITTGSDAKVNINPAPAVGLRHIRDINGNPAYMLGADKNAGAIPIAIERTIKEVNLTAVDRDVAPNGTTTIKMVFDKSMDLAGTDDEDVENTEFYLVEHVPGLVEDDDNAGVAVIKEAVLSTDGLTVTITLDGVIESTAAEDLPAISIVKNKAGEDMVGGDPAAPVREADKAARVPADKVGPYLKAASFSYNPVNGKDVAALIKDEALTLSVFFSEKITNPGILGSVTFEAGSSTADPAWEINSLAQSENSACEKDPNGNWKVVLRLDATWAEENKDDLPYISPTFNQGPTIAILSTMTNILRDSKDNAASDYNHAVDILDGTSLWASGAETEDMNGNGIVDNVIVTFGRKISIVSSKFQRDDDVIKINGDPNIITALSVAGNTSIKLALDEEGRREDTAWTPTVSFDLNANTSTVIKDYSGVVAPMEEDFSLSAADRVAPILVNFEAATGGGMDKIGVYEYKVEEESGVTTYWWTLKLRFSEPMDPNTWKEPTYAWRYIDNTANVDAIETFLTSDSTPPGTTSMSCGGNTIAVLLRTTLDVEGNDLQITLYNDSAAALTSYTYSVDDLNANQFEAGVADVGMVLQLKDAGLPVNKWNIPTDLQDNIIPTMKSMSIYGTITKDPNNDTIPSGYVYAFHRDQLFLTEAASESGDPNRGVFIIDPNRAYGAAEIQYDTLEDESTYYIKAYGQEVATGSQKGFSFGDPVILVVQDGIAADSPREIATTACLANAKYSIAFDGGPTKLPVEHNINLGEREVIKLRKGWNLVSTSISASYVNSSLCSLSGLNPDDFTRYIYGPDDILAAEEGSLPDEMYELKDISSVLFTLSHSFFTGNIFYDPATNPIFPVEDELADRFNKTPVFCTGRGYYIYIADVPRPLTPDPLDAADARIPAEWKIVLFGEKVPAPEYKLKVANTTDLIGQWGNLFYHTYDGGTAFNTIKNYLPSTVAVDLLHEDDTKVLADDIAGIDADLVAINVCDMNGDTVGMEVVSTFWNYPGMNYPVSWYAALPDFSDMSFVAPGVGYWILIDADTADGPFFVSYMPKPVED